MADWFLHSKDPTGRLGEAWQSGNSAVAAELAVLSRYASTFLITAGLVIYRHKRSRLIVVVVVGA